MKTLMLVLSLGLGLAGWHEAIHSPVLSGVPSTATAASSCVRSKMSGPESLADAMLAGKNLSQSDFEGFAVGLGRCAP